MRIENLDLRKVGDNVRTTATVTWEDNDRPVQQIYIETNQASADGLTCNPHAFLVGCIMHAMDHGEKRIAIDGEICPDLREGLLIAMSWFRHWYYNPTRPLVQIEAKTQKNSVQPRIIERRGLFFSGGIDSLATLRYNRLNTPRTHPSAIKDCLIIYGQNVESDNRPETFARAVKALAEVAADAGVTLIPIHTNLRALDEDTNLFLYKLQGTILAAVAHAFSNRLTSAIIASSYDIPKLFPKWGTHPIIDPNYGSSDMRILHDGIRFTRFEKTKLVAEWEVGLNNIRVCPPNWPGDNCGDCEKCVRTMLALLALGVLDQSHAFPKIEMTEALVHSRVKIKAKNVAFYEELVQPLTQSGHKNLAHILENKIEDFYHPEPMWKIKIRRFDQKYLGSALSKVRKALLTTQLPN